MTRRSRTPGLVTLCIAQAIGGVAMGIGFSFGGVVAEQLSSSQAIAGISTALMMLGAALLALPLVRLAAVGPGIGLAAGWLTTVAGAGGVVAAGHGAGFYALVPGTLLYGGGQAATLQARFVAVGLVAGGERARVMSLVLWSATVGSVIGPNLTMVGRFIGDLVGLDEILGVFILAAVAATCAALVTLRVRRSGALAGTATGDSVVSVVPVEPEPIESTSPKLRSGRLSVLAKNRRLRTAIIVLVLGQLVMVALMTMSPVHMVDEGMDLSFVGFSVSMHVVGMYGLSPIVGWHVDRFGRQPVVVGGQLISIAAAILALEFGQSHVLLAVALFCLGLGWSCSMIGGTALLLDAVPASSATRVQALSDAAISTAGAGGAFVSGSLLTQFGYGGLATTVGCLALCTLLAAAAPIRAAAGQPAAQTT